MGIRNKQYNLVHKKGENTMKEKWKLEMELSDGELQCLLNALDISTRLAAGQWDRLQHFANQNVDDNGKPMSEYLFMDYDIQDDLNEIRNKIMPWFAKKRLTGGASLGIYSPNLSEEAKVQYDIFKHVMYQRNKYLNIDNVYSREPLDASKEGAPDVLLTRQE